MILPCPYDSRLQCSLEMREQEVKRQIIDAQYLGEFKPTFVGNIVVECGAWPEKCWRLQEFKQKQR